MNTTEIKQVLDRALEKQIINAIPDNPELQKLLALDIAKRKDWERKAQDENEKYYEEALNEKIEDGLPIPHEIEGDPPNLPLDLTLLSDKEVRYLHGAFNACAARAGWLYALEETGLAAAKQIADHLEEEYIIGADRKDIGGKPKTQAFLKAEAQADNSDIIKWRRREHKHSIAANKYKRILDSYDSNCDRLSREWTMRMDEREHS